MPEYIALMCSIETISVQQDVQLEMTFDGCSFPVKQLFPPESKFVSAVQISSTSNGSFYKHNNIVPFANNTIENFELIFNTKLLYLKQFCTQSQRVIQERSSADKVFELFPYAGIYDENEGIESIKQLYAAPFIQDHQVLVNIRSAKGWNESGYATNPHSAMLTQEIFDGAISLELQGMGMSFAYSSFRYHEYDPKSRKIEIHFKKYDDSVTEI